MTDPTNTATQPDRIAIPHRKAFEALCCEIENRMEVLADDEGEDCPDHEDCESAVGKLSQMAPTHEGEPVDEAFEIVCIEFSSAEWTQVCISWENLLDWTDGECGFD